MAKKIIVIIFSILIFNTCMGMTTKQYSYQIDKKDKTINIVGQLIDENNEYSFLDYFEISDGRNKKNIKHRIKLVNNKIKIIKDNVEECKKIKSIKDINKKKILINVGILALFGVAFAFSRDVTLVKFILLIYGSFLFYKKY